MALVRRTYFPLRQTYARSFSPLPLSVAFRRPCRFPGNRSPSIGEFIQSKELLISCGQLRALSKLVSVLHRTTRRYSTAQLSISPVFADYSLNGMTSSLVSPRPNWSLSLVIQCAPWSRVPFIQRSTCCLTTVVMTDTSYVFTSEATINLLRHTPALKNLVLRSSALDQAANERVITALTVISVRRRQQGPQVC
ncbi:hypothetical protein DFH06DRAFT_1179735 [Mycena polygramma]|nr:hypothetical protein DFH06DRAFT_1179735 [Mycena polygramma]